MSRNFCGAVGGLCGFVKPQARNDAIGILLTIRRADGVRRRPVELARLAAGSPGVGIVDAAVKDLARAQRSVAIVLKVPRQGDPIGMGRAEPGVIVHHAGRRRITAREQRRARRIANRILHKGPIEANRRRSQPINIRRLHQLRAVAAQLRAEIVDHEKQHIQPLGRKSRSGSQQRDAKQDGQSHGRRLRQWAGSKGCYDLNRWRRGMLLRRERATLFTDSYMPTCTVRHPNPKRKRGQILCAASLTLRVKMIQAWRCGRNQVACDNLIIYRAVMRRPLIRIIHRN
jgi:hypothetical protein